MSDFGKLVIGCCVLVIMIICAYSGACDLAPGDARRILSQEGVTDVALHGYDWFACSRGEILNQEFSGTRNGQHVSGYVCGDAGGGITIHYK